MLLEVSNLETAYGASQVLFGFSMKIDQGEVVSLLGLNGMGKTTTVRSILGLTRSAGGSNLARCRRSGTASARIRQGRAAGRSVKVPGGSTGVAVLAVVGSIYLTRQPVFAAWPFAAAAAIFGLFAWWLYDENNAERSLLNAVTAAFFMYAAVFGVVLPSLTQLFPSVELARVLRAEVKRATRSFV